jgi:hypothetical protein
MRKLAFRKVIAWDQPNTSIATMDFCLPPSVVLVTEDSKIIALVKSQFLRDGGLI